MALFPYSNFHNLNMDWIIKTLKQIIEKLENIPSGYGVNSVNGKTGVVVLDAENVGAVTKNQGEINAGKFMIVNSDGIVSPIEVETWGGGSY